MNYFNCNASTIFWIFSSKTFWVFSKASTLLKGVFYTKIEFNFRFCTTRACCHTSAFIGVVDKHIRFRNVYIFYFTSKWVECFR